MLVRRCTNGVSFALTPHRQKLVERKITGSNTFTTGARINERLEAKRDLPAYGLAEAAHYIRVPAATLRSWVLGRSYESREGKRQFAPLIRAADRHVPVLSFSNLLEAFVLRALRTEHGVPIKAVRSALRYAERELDVQRLLLNKQLCTTGGELFLDRYGQLVNLTRSGQLAMKAVLEAHLKRVEWSEDDVAVRLYPFVRGESAESPRVIAIDPLIAFGRPVVARRGVSTQAIVDRIDAGESLADVADDYEVSESEVEEAIVYQRAA